MIKKIIGTSSEKATKLLFSGVLIYVLLSVIKLLTSIFAEKFYSNMALYTGIYVAQNVLVILSVLLILFGIIPIIYKVHRVLEINIEKHDNAEAAPAVEVKSTEQEVEA